MILADTSVWIDHFRAGDKELRRQLEQGNVVIHPFIISELALGSLRERRRVLALLDSLPPLRIAQTDEVRAMLEERVLYGHGIGLVDAQLIASSLIRPGTMLWTRDRRLRKAAEKLGIHANLA